jgi:DNA-binding transcriptional regulator LsrR (DeoR family)
MPRTVHDETQLDMLTAAFLVGDGMKQIDIARVLDMSQAAVSRLLAQARKTYLQEEVRFLREKVPPETMKQIVQRSSRHSLAIRLDGIARSAAGVRGPVLRCFPCSAPPDPAMERMTELSRLASSWIREMILRCTSFGVTWGGMLSRVVVAQRALSVAPPWKSAPIDVIPLSGEPLGDSPTTYSSSSIAHELGIIINGDAYNARSLAMVPAFVPDGFSPSQTAGVWRLIGLVKSHAEIFGPHNASKSSGDALASRLDMILSSVGPAERPLGFGKGRLFETGNLKVQELRRLVVGDMGGVLFPRERLNAQQKAKLDAVATRWTGLTVDHLQRCSRRAHDQPDPFGGPPGVVVVCIGRERAPFLIEAIKQGIINHLIIDDELQEELDRLTRGLTQHRRSGMSEATTLTEHFDGERFRPAAPLAESAVVQRHVRLGSHRASRRAHRFLAAHPLRLPG